MASSKERNNLLQDLADNSHRQDNSYMQRGGAYGSVDGCSSDVDGRTGASEHWHDSNEDVLLVGLSGHEGSKQCRKKYITHDSITFFFCTIANKCSPYE